MNDIHPGDDGDPLPTGEWVIRLVKLSKDGYVSPEMFELSTNEKNAIPPRLSVWAEKLTSDEQAWQLTGCNLSKNTIASLNIDTIRSLVPEPNSPETHHLEVEWEPKRLRDGEGKLILGEDGMPILDSKPGAKGHAGIRYLREGTKAQYKSLRSQLAEKANQKLRTISSGIPDNPYGDVAMKH
ncbi:hypothetical protein [Singulisphaera acidiphila]|uniref:Uncharacterized protein n=1 Tax=Singulisphaera acidiphila (strain ATCC BAA-1392 / DSM 18658 / VKM B-2454 / MOB10) TaxID=886293 RepID=L0DHH2_SINAD|nr:hypothetical protein [Singulisphaera acidiphila]AGA28300.1 hypothetical protein Sinac_4085 [Singulisphaera acidiphila DSM 18658]